VSTLDQVPPPPVRRTSRVGTVGVTLALVAAGLLFTTSAHTARGTQLRADRPDLVGLIRSENARVEARVRRVEALRAEVDADTMAVAAGGVEVDRLRSEGQSLSAAAGLSPVSGPGLEVTLDDAPRGAPVPQSVKPDDLVVHQQDVQAVVNALWTGGAEAMMLQDQRVISTSAVRCVGNTLILQGRVYSPPYVITAIGDVDRMRRALNDSAYVALYREYVAAVGLGYAVRSSDDLRLPAFAGSLDLRYAHTPGASGRSGDITPGGASEPTTSETG
jgi:uncharacterized protein YlxW (UPF0749 family)